MRRERRNCQRKNAQNKIQEIYSENEIRTIQLAKKMPEETSHSQHRKMNMSKKMDVCHLTKKEAEI